MYQIGPTGVSIWDEGGSFWVALSGGYFWGLSRRAVRLRKKLQVEAFGDRVYKCGGWFWDIYTIIKVESFGVCVDGTLVSNQLERDGLYV